MPPWAEISPERVAHVTRVAQLAAEWAEAMSVPDSERNRWLRAVWLHDALRDAAPETLTQWAASITGPVELRHGPASAARAKAEGETDRGVLDAVRYHSVGLPEWDMVGRVLYCADYLEPGRDFDQRHRAELAADFPLRSRHVLREVARARMLHVIESDWPLPEPMVRFWNSLAEPAS